MVNKTLDEPFSLREKVPEGRMRVIIYEKNPQKNNNISY
jgi:hypothetical protein